MRETRVNPTGTVRRVLALAAVLMLTVACGSTGGSSAGSQTRTVQVDYNHDEFATSMFENYPRRVQVRPGDTVEFRQTWTGEPHSVTMGTLVDEKIQPLLDLFTGIETTGEFPEEEPTEFEAFYEALPFAFAENGMAQNAAQPCYVEAEQFAGTYPGDETTPCPKQEQPAFNGRQAIYNSGVIPYEGVDGNTFRVELADDISPGIYSYYCNVHGALQYGQIEVLDQGSDIPSQAEVARQALEEQRATIAAMEPNFNAATAGEAVEGGEQLVGRLGDRRQVDRGREHVVRGLTHVHVVVRVNGIARADRLVRELATAVRDHLVRVRVRAGAGTGLENIEREMLVELAFGHFLGGLHDQRRAVRIEQSEIVVGLRRAPLDQT